MTEQSKIPLPQDARPHANEGKSSLERAVETFNLRDFAPPPVPKALAPDKPRLALRQPSATPRHHDTLPEQAAAAGDVHRAVVGQILSEPAEPAAAPVRPVEFSDVEHPLDHEQLRAQGFIQPGAKVTALLEEFRIVKRQIIANARDLHRRGGGSAGQRVLISSPHPGEGKTYCAVNLALAMAAEMDSEVLLVDADFAKPSIPRVLGLPEGPGLMDALADENADVASFVMRTDLPSLSVLPAGATTTRDSEYLTSSRTARVLDRLTEGAPQRIVVFDSPPALAASPAAELAKHVAQAIVIVRAQKTGQGALEDAVSLLSACPNIHLLLNAVLFSPSGRRFGDYYGYGENGHVA